MKLKISQAPVQVGFEFEFGGNLEDKLKELVKKHLGVELGNNRQGFKSWCLTNYYTYNGDCIDEYEVVSPVMEFDEFIKVLRKFLKMMRDSKQRTDDISGLHINISFKNKRLHKKIKKNLTELWLNIPEKDILMKFNRIGNNYCKPFALTCVRDFNDIEEWGNGYSDENIEINVEKFNQYIYRKMKHSSSIDLSRIKNNTNGSRIEFRMTGGPSYPTKVNDIIKVMRNIYRLAMLKSINEKPSTTKRKLFKFVRE